MKSLSSNKLADIIKSKRKQKDLSQEELGKLTNINRIMVGRIENKTFIPSISQLESLSSVLEFNIADIFIEKQKTNSFVALRSEAITKKEKEGVDKLFLMMLNIRQQIVLRRKYDDEKRNS